jgi:hypothetical protein
MALAVKEAAYGRAIRKCFRLRDRVRRSGAVAARLSEIPAVRVILIEALGTVILLNRCTLDVRNRGVRSTLRVTVERSAQEEKQCRPLQQPPG